MSDAHLTERQQKWFASVRAGLERDTGRPMAAWVEIALTCPQAAHRARLKWFKEVHGLAQNPASLVLDEAFGRAMGWDEPEALVEALWIDPQARTIFEAVRGCATDLDGAIMGPRKAFTAFSRKVQFCAVRPLKGGGVLMGLAVKPEADGRLAPRGKNESWSERLYGQLVLADEAALDDGVKALIAQAWAAS